LQCRQDGGGEAVEITGDRWSERGPGGRLCCIKFLYFSVLAFFVDFKNSPLRPSPGHSATDCQSFRFTVNIFSRSVLVGGGGGGGEGRKILSPGPEPALNGPGSVANPASYSMGIGSPLPGGIKRPGLEVNHLPPTQFPSLRMNGAVLPLPRYAFMAWAGTNITNYL